MLCYMYQVLSFFFHFFLGLYFEDFFSTCIYISLISSLFFQRKKPFNHVGKADYWELSLWQMIIGVNWLLLKVSKVCFGKMT